MATNKDIGSILEQLATEIEKPNENIIDKDNFSIYGDVLQSFKNFNQVIDDINKTGNSSLNYSNIKQDLIMSISALRKSVKGQTAGIIDQLQSGVVDMLSSAQDIITKQIESTSQAVKKLDSVYLDRIAEIRKDGEKIIKATASNTVKRGSNSTVSEQYKQGIIAMPSEMVANNVYAQSSLKEKTLRNADDILNAALKKSSNTYASSLRDLKNFVTKYKGIIEDSSIIQINKQIEEFVGYDKNFNLNALKPIAQSISDAIPQSIKDSFKISTKTTNSKQWTAYNTDEFYGGTLGGKSFTDKIIKEMGLSELVSGDLLKQRIKQIGGNTQGLNTNTDQMKSQLLNMFSRLEEYGIGSYWEKSKSGQTARIGFFNAKDQDKIFTSSGNGITADWNQMAKVTLGIPNSQGNVVVGNMNRPDVFVPRLKNDAGVFKAEMATLSQTILEQFTDIVSSDFFLSSLKRGNYGAAISRLNGGINDLVSNVATNATYGVYSQDAINDVNDDMQAGSSSKKRLYQNNTIKLRSILENLYKNTWGNGQLPEAKQMEQMMQYVYAKFSGGESAFLNNPEYEWLTSGTSQLNQIANMMKEYAPNAGISKVKEIAFLGGDIAGVDSNALSPFFVVNSGVNRSISQGANYVKRARKIAKKDKRTAILRSSIAESNGIDYNAPENQQYTIAEATNDEIANALRSYYTELANNGDIDTLSKLYQRYYGKDSYKRVKGNVNKIVEGLKNREMPSTYEGGAIASDKFKREQEGYREKTVELSEEDLGRLGITARPNSSNPIMKLNKKDYQNVIKGKGITLSDGTVLKGDRRGRTFLGDRLHSISYDETTGKYQLAYDEFMGDKYVKHVSSAGDRLTFGNYVTEDELAAINRYLGLENNKAQIFTEPTKVDNRKIAGLTEKKYEQLFQRIKETGKFEDFQKYIEEDAKNNGILSRMLSYNADDNTLWQKSFSIDNFKKTFSQSEAEQLYDTFNENGIYAQLIKKFLSEQDYKELMHRNIGSAAVGKANEYYYFDPIGSTSKEYAETASHYKYTKLQDAAIARELGLLKATGEDNSALAEVFARYSSANENTIQELKNKETALRQAWKATTEGKLPKNLEDYTLLSGKGLIDEIDRSNGGISSGMFSKTILGTAYNTKVNEGKTSYIDLTSKNREQGVNIASDGDSSNYIQKLIIPNLKPKITSDGHYIVDELESQFRNVLKNLEYVQAYENGKGFDKEAPAYKNAVADLEKSVGELLATENNTLYYKKGSLQSGLQNTRLTNAMSAKAVTKSFSQSSDYSSNFANLDNAVVLNDEDFKALLRTGKGGDIQKNIQNLSWQAEHMLSGLTDDKEAEGVLKRIQNLANTDFSTSKITERAAEDEIIDLIAKMSNVENGRITGLQAWFHRNPFINGEDVKFTNLYNSSKLGRGEMYNSLGLGTDVNMDFDGDTGYISLPMFGAVDKNTYELAAKQFDKFKEIQTYVNNALRNNIMKEYSSKNGSMDTNALADNSENVRKAISSFYSNEGTDATLQSILSKSNFKYVGALDNVAKAMYLSFSEGLDEQSGDPLTAGRAILGRALFEQMTQDAISSKKVGQRLQKRLGGGNLTEEEIAAEYEKELGNLENILASAKNIGKNGDSATGISELVDNLEKTGLLDFNSPNRTSISAIARVEAMLKMRYGEDTEAYEDAMKKLGIWESRTDGNTDKSGVLSAEQYKSFLTGIANDFDKLHPGQSIMGWGYKELSKQGQYLTDKDKIANLLQIRRNVEARSVLGNTVKEEKDGETGQIKRTANFHEIANMLNPKGATASWKETIQKLETSDEKKVSEMLNAQSDEELGKILGLSGNNIEAFKKTYVRQAVGNMVHQIHEKGFIDTDLYNKMFGIDIKDDDGIITSHQNGMFGRLGISEEQQERIRQNVLYRYNQQDRAFKIANSDLLSDKNHAIFNEQGIGGKISQINGQDFFAQGIADRIITGKSANGREAMRFVEWKNVGSLGVDEFAQNLLQVAIAQRMRDMAKQLSAQGKNSKQIAKTLEKQFGNGYNGKINTNFVDKLLSSEDITGQLIGTDNKGNTKVFSTKANINLPKQILDAIEQGQDLHAIYSKWEDAENAIKSAYTENKSAEIVSTGTEEAYLTNVDKRKDPQKMLQEYKSYISQKQAIDQNYATLQAQLAGMSDKDPNRKAYEDRLKRLGELKEKNANTYYHVGEDGTVIKFADGQIESYTKAQGEMIEQFQQVSQGAENQNKAMMKIAKTNNAVTKTIASLTGQFKGMLRYYAMYGMVQKVIGSVMQTFQKFIQSVKELDSALVKLQIVTGKSKNELKDYVSDYIDIADEMGRTTTEVMSAANDWLRAGYDIKDANLLIKDSLKLSTLGMMDAEKATESLLSTMKGWKLTAEEVSGVVDNLTALDVAYATSAGDIATAMSKGNVSASLAGVDMKNYEAYLTTVLDVSQQSAETVGTAFKTLFARYGNVKSGKYANNYNFGESDQETTEDTTKLNDVETVLNKIGIKTRDTIGEFRSMDEVLDEVASKWASYDKVTKNAITTAMAGTRQREVLNVLFENYGEVEKARNIIDNSEGSADKKYEAYNNSIEAGQKRLANAMQEIAQGEGWKNILIDIYDILKTGTDVLGVILDKIIPIAAIGGTLIGLKNIGSIASLISRVGTNGTNFFRGIGSGIGNAVGGIGGGIKYIRNNGITNSLNKYANAQAFYEYGVGVNNTAQKLYGRLANTDQLDYNLSGPMFTGNVFNTEDYNAATRFLTNSKFLNMTQGLGVSGTNALFQNVLTGFSENKAGLATAYQNYINALNGGAVNLETANTDLVNALMQCGFKSEESAREFIKLTAHTEMTGDQIAAAGLIYQEGGNRIRIPGTNNLNGGKSFKEKISQFNKSNLGQSVGMMGGMALGMGSSMLIMENASQDLGTGGTMALSTLTSLAPMIGNAILPGLGGLIGGGVSALIGAGTALWAKSNKTSEEILQEAQKASEKLDKIRDKISTAEDTRSKLEDNEVRFAELVKGVNSSTGQNVSLSDSEWSEYQDILSTIIDSHDDLYASYDAEGNIVAKNAGSIADLNTVMAKSINFQKEQMRLENERLAGDIGGLATEVKGNIENTKKEYTPQNNPDNEFGLNFVDFYLSSQQGYTKFNGEDVDFSENTTKDTWLTPLAVLSNLGYRFFPSDFGAEATKNNMLALLKTANESSAKKEDTIQALLDMGITHGYTKKSLTKEEAERIYDNYQLYYDANKQKESAVQTQYKKDISQRIGYALKGSENFTSLSDEQQSYLLNDLFGSNIAVSYYHDDGTEKTNKEIETSIQHYQTAAKKIADKVKDGTYSLDSIITAQSSTATKDQDNKAKEDLVAMINANTDLSAEEKYAILKGSGLTPEGFKWEDGKIIETGNWKSKREITTEKLSNLDWDTKVLNELSTEQLNALFENSDTISVTNTLTKLKQELSELILGENATLTEYFADFANQTGTSLSDIEGLKEALANPENQDLFSLKKLKESFKELGYDVEKTDVLAEALVKHMSTLGSIDANGYTSKSLSEIESQFENINSIVSDLVDNGKLSVENMQKLLEEFPEMIKYLGEGKDLLEAMEELQKDQAELQFASIKNTIAENEENYTEFLSTLEKEGKINDNLKDYLGMFGNSKNLVSLFNQMYQENENGNYMLKSRYKDMRLMDNSDFSQNSWEKIVGKYIFGIDTTTGTKEDISRKISDAVQAQADKLGLEGSTPEFIDIYRNMMMNNPEFIGAFQNIADLENQLAAAKASQQLENSQWEEKVSKEISKLKDAFDAGKISIDDYIKGLQEIRRWSNLTEEQIRELDEAIEDAKFDKLSDQFDKGQISVKNYREELSKLMKNNALGSDDYNKFLEAYLGTYDTEISKLENQKSLLADKDFQGQKNILNQENLIYEEKLAALTAAGQKNSEAYLEVLEKIKSNKEQQLEITKQELEYEKEKLETVMDAYSTLIDYRINQLQKEKDLLEERYDDEIDKLKEVNDQKQRSIDLEKYQQELENARKEKSRIYISGVGWTYQANQAKVDEAQTNLDNYLEDRKISDLENSKNREAKYYQDQIDFWNETKEKIEDVPKLANAEEAVKELIRNNVVAEGSTINTALTDIKKGITVDVDGHVVDLGIKFNTFSNNYSTVTSNLNDLNSAMDGKLGAISDWIKSYKSANDMVEALKKAFTAGVSNLNINKPQQSTVNWDKKIGEITDRLNAANKYLLSLVSINAYKGTTLSPGIWGNGKYYNFVNKTSIKGNDGNYYWAMTNSQTGEVSYIKADNKNIGIVQDGKYRGRYIAKAGTDYYSAAMIIGQRSNGLEGGMISRTGLYKLHGTPNNPEFVLNSKQAYQLLRNISTLSIPAFESKTSTNKTINYQFYGDMNLPNVKDPSTFFSELLREADGKFNVTKLEY